jgi:hypothetical protein
MVADLSVHVIDLNVRGKSRSARSASFPTFCISSQLGKGRVVGKVTLPAVFDKGHYHLLPCLSGRALCERSLGPYRVNLRRGVSRVRSGQRHKLGISL